MRIAVSFPGCYRRGGVERVVLETVNELDRLGHDVHLFASEWDEQALTPGVACHRVDLGDRLPLARVRRFPTRCRAVIRATGLAFNAHGAFGVMSPPGGTIWVGSVHAAWLRVSQSHRGLTGRLRQVLNPYHRVILALERQVFAGRQYRKLIALTDRVKQDLIDHYATPADDIEILPNGFSQTEFNVPRRLRERESVRAELGYRPEHKVVVFVANETERKGFGPLIRSIAKLGDPLVHLLAVGRLNAGAYHAEIERLGLAGRVRFTGPACDVGGYYAASDVFALPTTYEAWGLVIVEAMACGLPVLTSRVAGAAETVREGATGELLDDPRDVNEIAHKLDRLLQGNHASPADVSASVQQYHWTNILQQYEAILVNHCNATESEASAIAGTAAH
jgi:UDP-glucose:(heptosyl)LPS alpha-1,3-glucosyltransferase